MIEELNDIDMKDIPSVLKNDTLMERHWPLIISGPRICALLIEAGYTTSHSLLEIADAGPIIAIADRIGVDPNQLRLLRGLLKHHRFKPISISKLPDIRQDMLVALKDNGFESTREVIKLLGQPAQREAVGRRLSTSIDELETVVSVSDLMRKPGVKETKVRLFRAAGIHSLASLGSVEPVMFRETLSTIVQSSSIAKAIPTPKEISSDIAWARIYPILVKV